MAAIISIIIPTHNRKASLQRTLDALSRQTVSPHLMEVLVVADGCTDNTMEMLIRYTAPFTLQMIVEVGQGAATARNRGAALARGQILLFLDDDVEPTPTFVATHIAAHQERPGRVVVGAYPPVVCRHASFFQSQIRAWWEQKFVTLDDPAHRFTYRDLLSGNLSLAADLFKQIRGFDESIANCGGEDYELGVRLLKANLEFTFVADAIGYHYVHETTDLIRAFQRARQEGRVDVRLGQRYPELRTQLPIAAISTYRLRNRMMLRLLLFQWPLIGNLLAIYLQRLLDDLERYGLHDYWHTLYRFLYGYWYWRGVADKVASWQILIHFVTAAKAALTEYIPCSELDLSQGLATAAQQIDMERPNALRIYYGHQPIGLVPPQSGAERLRGVHLRTILQRGLAAPYLEALAIEGGISGSSQLDRYQLFQSIRAKTLWFGPTQINQMWYEQYSQWGYLDQHEPLQKMPPDRDWEDRRKKEYELAWSAQIPIAISWRRRLYQTLYRWHEPLYHWYTERGWTWPTKLRQRIKQMLVHQTQI